MHPRHSLEDTCALCRLCPHMDYCLLQLNPPLSVESDPKFHALEEGKPRPQGANPGHQMSTQVEIQPGPSPCTTKDRSFPQLTTGEGQKFTCNARRVWGPSSPPWAGAAPDESAQGSSPQGDRQDTMSLHWIQIQHPTHSLSIGHG